MQEVPAVYSKADHHQVGDAYSHVVGSDTFGSEVELNLISNVVVLPLVDPVANHENYDDPCDHHRHQCKIPEIDGERGRVRV